MKWLLNMPKSKHKLMRLQQGLVEFKKDNKELVRQCLPHV